jgi:two-component system phosphate regulon sensor histidine kinase PhoR
MIRDEADRLAEMVRVFLDIERLGGDRWENARTDLDLAAIAEARCRMLESVAAARGQSLGVEVSAVPTISGVEQLISQLVDNLVGNAIKFASAGSEIKVEIGPDAGNEVILKVCDRGPGIPPDAVPHLFERFYRVPGAEAKGSGLGLALVKEVADWHGAAIYVESEVGEGSCFTVVFPHNGARE